MLRNGYLKGYKMKLSMNHEQYSKLVDTCGGAKPFDPKGDNWFVVYGHMIGLYVEFTVNDGYEAPERIYMTHETASKVRLALNTMILKHNLRKAEDESNS